MKLRAYDKYNKRPLIIEFDDELNLNSFSSHNASGTVFISISTDESSWKKYGLEYDEDGEQYWNNDWNACIDEFDERLAEMVGKTKEGESDE